MLRGCIRRNVAGGEPYIKAGARLLPPRPPGMAVTADEQKICAASCHVVS
jgi:hypothetical protein